MGGDARRLGQKIMTMMEHLKTERFDKIEEVKDSLNDIEVEHLNMLLPNWDCVGRLETRRGCELMSTTCSLVERSWEDEFYSIAFGSRIKFVQDYNQKGIPDFGLCRFSCFCRRSRLCVEKVGDNRDFRVFADFVVFCETNNPLQTSTNGISVYRTI